LSQYEAILNDAFTKFRNTTFDFAGKAHQTLDTNPLSHAYIKN